MKYLTTPLIFVTVLFIQSCKTTSSCFKQPRVIFTEHVNLLSKYTCGLEDRFTPTLDDVEQAEEAICNADSLVKKVFYARKLKDYRRQFLGFKNKNGEKILIVNLEHKKLFKNKKADMNTYFQTEFNQGFGETFGKYQRILSVNVSTRKVTFPCN